MSCKVSQSLTDCHTDSRGVCIGDCSACGSHLQLTGRNTLFCPSCDVCSTCGCPDADGFAHYGECPEGDIPDDEE